MNGKKSLIGSNNMEYPPTDEQAAIIEAFGTEPALIVQARAGTGKTDTIRRICHAHPKKKIITVAFNKKNAKDLEKKLPKENTTSSTFHSYCLKMLGKRLPIDNENQRISSRVYKKYPFNEETLEKDESIQMREDYDNMTKLVNLAQVYYLNPDFEGVKFLMDHYGISLSETDLEVANNCISIVNDMDRNQDAVNFNEMIRFPLLNGTLRVDGDLFIVDEIQDNPPIRTMVMADLAKKGMQIGGVGDQFQSIYGFAGAAHNSMELITAALNPKELPLSVNFRCGKSIILEAQKIVPDIKAWGQSPEGKVRYILSDEFKKEGRNGDLVIAKFNKTIIGPCFSLIKQGIKANILGKDFGKILASTVHSFKAKNIDDFMQRLDRWYGNQMKYCKSDAGIEAITDRFECLRYFADSCATVEEIIQKIDVIFKDESQGEGVLFSTIHRAKGAEKDRVIILEASLFYATQNRMKEWEKIQLKHLDYVSRTRAKTEMIYCG